MADIAVAIDEGKKITDANVVNLTDRGIRLIAHLKLLGLDIRALQETFAGMQLICGDRVVLAELVDIYLTVCNA